MQTIHLTNTNEGVLFGFIWRGGFLTMHESHILEAYLRGEGTKEAADCEQKRIIMRAEEIEQESTLS